MVRATDARAASDLAAAAIAERLRAALAVPGRVSLALAGGTTPAPAYRRLAAAPGIAWDRVVAFLADERWVAPTDPESNERMVRTELLDRLPVAPAAFVSWTVDLDRVPDQVASAFAERLLAALGPGPSGPPRLDGAVLGLGPEGHTASLFPGSAALDDPLPARAVWVEPRGDWRLTTTPRLLAAAGWVVILATGAAKAEAVAAVAQGPLDPARWPAQAVVRRGADCTLFCDPAAAAMLGPGTP